MGFQIGGTILDFVVLSILRSKDEYGYTITQQVREILDVSETAIYPALKRLEKSGALSTYDVPVQGRNRRYYKISETGIHTFNTYLSDWQLFKSNMQNLLKENTTNDT